jgi:hypothetical protein
MGLPSDRDAAVPKGHTQTEPIEDDYLDDGLLVDFR